MDHHRRRPQRDHLPVAERILSQGRGRPQRAAPFCGFGQVKIDTFGASTATTVCRNSGVLSACTSSIRYKTNVKDAPFGLAEVEKMRPVTFDWKEKKEQSWEQHDFGFIAEDMEKTNPMFVTYDKDGKIEGVKYTQLTAVLVNAIKEQQAEIEALKAANDNMQREIDALKAQIAH